MQSTQKIMETFRRTKRKVAVDSEECVMVRECNDKPCYAVLELDEVELDL